MDAGVVAYAVLCLAMVVLGLSLPRTPVAARALLTVARRLRLLPAPAPTPSGRPLERIAGDVRRLRGEAATPRPGISMARQRGIVAAYDDHLVAACHALGIPTDLLGWPESLERDAERIRVEIALEEAGLDLGGHRHAA